MGTGSYQGVKRPGRGADHPPPSKCRGQERAGLYLYSPLWAFMACYGSTYDTFQVPLYYFDQLNDKYSQVSYCFKKCHAFSYTDNIGSLFLYCENKLWGIGNTRYLTLPPSSDITSALSDHYGRLGYVWRQMSVEGIMRCGGAGTRTAKH